VAFCIDLKLPECIWYYYFIYHLRTAYKKKDNSRTQKLAIALIC